MSEPTTEAWRCSAVWNGCRCGRKPHRDDRHVWMNTLDDGAAVDPAEYPDARASQPLTLDVERPRVVCICGSTRFAEHMNTEAERLTLAGAIVVRPEVIAYSRERDQQFVEPDVKAALDVLHLRKIDLADEVVVVTVDGYVGESTRREMDYAERTGKPVRFAEYRP